MAGYMEGFSKDRTDADAYDLYDPHAPLSEVTDFSYQRRITPDEAREVTLPPIYRPFARQRQLDRYGKDFGLKIVGSAASLSPFPKHVASRRHLVMMAEVAIKVDEQMAFIRGLDRRPAVESTEVVRDDLGNPLLEWPTSEAPELPRPDDQR